MTTNKENTAPVVDSIDAALKIRKIQPNPAMIAAVKAEVEKAGSPLPTKSYTDKADWTNDGIAIMFKGGTKVDHTDERVCRLAAILKPNGNLSPVRRGARIAYPESRP